MLQQILETMYVDPELLELMTADQKELLFRRMREEQLRKWSLRENEMERKPPPKKSPRKIQFLLGVDGKPWTWVMGDHSSDLSYDELVRQRERREREEEEEEEREILRQAEEFAKLETGHILSLASRFGELNSPSSSPHHSPSGSPAYHKRMSLDVGKGGGGGVRQKQAVRRLASDSAMSSMARASISGPLLTVPESLSSSSLLSSSMPRTESQLDLTSSTEHIDTETSDSPLTLARSRSAQEDLRRSTLRKQVPIIGKTKEEQQKFQEKRTEEIVSTMKEVKQLARKRSIAVANSVEERWRESEEKAKAFERTRKASFNKARQISKRVAKIDEQQILEGIPEERKRELEQKIWDRNKQTRRAVRPARLPPSKSLTRQSSIVLPGTRPKTPTHVVAWFRETEAPRGHCRERDGTISLWFHGRLGRAKAEDKLDRKPVGSYLVRLSAKMWGYTISVKTYTDVKHFLVDASSGKYQFIGPQQRQFRSLNQLLNFYKSNPITAAGQEVLLVPVPQLEPEDSSLFKDLFRDEDDEEVWSTFL